LKRIAFMNLSEDAGKNTRICFPGKNPSAQTCFRMSGHAA